MKNTRKGMNKMSWDLDTMNVLPIDKQEDVSENFSPQYLAEVLSDYVVELQEEIKVLKRTSIKIQPASKGLNNDT